MRTNILLGFAALIATACTSPDSTQTDTQAAPLVQPALAPVQAPTESPVSLPTATPAASVIPAPSTTPTATPSPTAAPTATPNVVTVTHTATNSDHTCSIMSDSTVQCSGNNVYDQAPAVITGLTHPSTIAIGNTISCVIDGNKNVYCWGAGAYVGNGLTQSNTATPVETVTFSNVTALSAYGNAACAISGTNAPMCWGSILSGSNEAIATEDVGIVSDTLTQVAVGNNMKCVLGAHLWCWNGSHTLTQQNLWSGTYASISTNSTGQICVSGTVGVAPISQCYSSIGSNGQL